MENEVDVKDGVECPHRHFYCNSCFSLHIRTKSNDHQNIIRARDGKVYCPGKLRSGANVRNGGQDCPFEYSLGIVAAHGSQSAIDHYTRNITRIGEWKGAEVQRRIYEELEKQKQNALTDDFLGQFAKACPRCQTREGSGCLVKGHGCHHIKCGNSKCKYEWCNVCQGNYGRCGCPFQGGTGCWPRCSSCHKKEFDIEADMQCSCPRKERTFVDCGCLPCNICKPGNPCAECDKIGDCPSCNPPRTTTVYRSYGK